MTKYTRGARRRRKKSHAKSVVLTLLGLIALAGGAHYLIGCNKPVAAPVEPPTATELTYLETPDGIAEQIVAYKGMTVSFNPELHIPNWVAWDLTADEAAGTEPRTNKFFRDEKVDGCPEPSDYSGSGYDRGHMAPAGDMKWDADAMAETFLLTNIAPQANALNQKAWKTVEEKCRARTAMDSVLYIVCGPVPGDEPLEYIGAAKVAVPQRFFKVICAPYANPPYTIGFIMPNGRVEGGAQKAAVTVNEVEALTGYDFFSALDDDIEEELEGRVNFDRWSRLK